MYAEGQGLMQDYAEAMKWLLLAAEQDDRLAQLSLGQMYAMGRGAQRDYVQAYFWLDLCGFTEALRQTEA